MSFDLIGSMEREVRGKRKPRRANPNELGRLPIDQIALDNIFGGVRPNGNGKRKKNQPFMDIGFDLQDEGNALSGFGDACVDCRNEEDGKVFNKQVRSEGFLEGFDVQDLGGAFNGRFKNIGGGFIESVNVGKVGAIDFDKGAKASDVVSPVFRTGESFGIKRGKLEKSIERETRRRVGRPRKKKSEKETKQKGVKVGKAVIGGSEGERVIDVVRRKIKERKEKRGQKISLGRGQGEMLSSGSQFTSTRVSLGEARPAGSNGAMRELPSARETPEPIREVFRREREEAERG